MINGKGVAISLFSGGFGLDLGLEQAGFQTAAVVENDPDAVKTIAINRPYLIESAIPRSICSVSAEMLLEEGGRALSLGRALRRSEVDLVAGGPPCQSFSTAGRRGSVNDPRGSLFMDFVRIVDAIQPKFFIMENVRGILSAAIRHRPINQRGEGFPSLEPDEEQGSALKVILEEIHKLGYNVVYNLLETANYGVPQNRSRVVFIGVKEGESTSFPLPTHSQKGKPGAKWKTLRETLDGLNDPKPEFVPYPESRLKYLRLLKSGQNWRYLPEDLKEEAMGGAYKSGGGKVGFYRRLDWDKPSPTVLTCPHQKATDMCHPEELRPLSVQECKRIQTFPDDWIFYGSITSQYRQIGNAVPVLFAQAIGEHLYQILTTRKTKKTLYQERIKARS